MNVAAPGRIGQQFTASLGGQGLPASGDPPRSRIRNEEELHSAESLCGAVLEGDFSGVDFSGLNMQGADFTNAQARKANFRGANLA